MRNWAGFRRFLSGETIAPLQSFFGLALVFSLMWSTTALEAATVTGHAYLQGQTNNSGIHVTFTAITPSAQTDSTQTDSTGLYSITLANGYYLAGFVHAGFYSSSYPDTIISVETDTLQNDTLRLIPGSALSGSVSGTLYPGIAYVARGNLTIPAGQTLTILPGTVIQFDSSISLTDSGHIIARGTINDSIIFTTSRRTPTPAYWAGIIVADSDYQNVFAFCRIEYSSGIQLGWYSHTTVDSCMFENNASGMNIDGSAAHVIGNTFQGNARGIFAQSGWYQIRGDDFAIVRDTTLIEENTFSGNAQNILLSDDYSRIVENVFEDYNGQGVALSNLFPMDEGNPLLSHNVFLRFKGRGIFVDGYSYATITHDSLYNLSGNAIYAAESVDSCVIFNDTGWAIESGSAGYAFSYNVIHDCDSGIYALSDGANHNLIYRVGRAIICYGNNCRIASNTVSEAGVGLSISDSYNSVIEENAFTSCQSGIVTDSSLAHDTFGFNDFFGNSELVNGPTLLGLGQNILTNGAGDSADTYSNIFYNPSYADTAHGNFHLLSNSPLINAGDPTLPKDPDSTVADIGAFYHDKSILAVQLHSSNVPSHFSLAQNYPNPFNPTSTIKYDLPKAAYVRLSVYNVLGQEVRTLVDQTETAGYKSVTFEGSSLPSGVYFYRLTALQTAGGSTGSGKDGQAGSFSDVKKMALIK